MNDLLYSIGDLFEATFEILAVAGNIPNILFALLGAVALSFCMKVVTSEENICE